MKRMFDVGWSEATVILLLALLLFGPDKLADFARKLGKLYGEYKTARRRLELELLYGKEVIDREYLRDIAKMKLEMPDLERIVDFAEVKKIGMEDIKDKDEDLKDVERFKGGA